MNDKAQYACPQCGAEEYLAKLNSWDLYYAANDKLYWRKTEHVDSDIQLYCTQCGERAPVAFEAAAQ